MKILLDTHVFVWWRSEPSRLSATVANALQDPTSEVLLSAASVWEMQIKHQLGKLALAEPLQQLVADELANGLQVLPVLANHVYSLDKLPAIHRDPFDRMLIAQAIAEGVTLASGDSVIAQYPVQVLW